jgi:hypothetical protein
LIQAILQHRSGKNNAPAKVPGLRWWMMTLLMMGSILNFLTRSTPLIWRELVW